jgi:hypothetical protein
MAGVFYHVHVSGQRLGGALDFAEALELLESKLEGEFPGANKAHIVCEHWGGGGHAEDVVYRTELRDGVWTVTKDDFGLRALLRAPMDIGHRSRLSPLAQRATARP